MNGLEPNAFGWGTPQYQRARLPQRRAVGLAGIAAIVVAQTRLRAEYLPAAACDDPQWMIVLDMFIAMENGRNTCISDACVASGVPMATALRHLRCLEESGIIIRTAHPTDKRSSYLTLEETARRNVANYLLSISSRWLAVNDDMQTRSGAIDE